MKLTIKDKEIELKYSLRSMILFENVTGETFNPKTFTDILTFFYCVVISSSKDYTIKFEEFIDYVDSNIEILNEFSEWMETVVSVNDTLKKK